MRSRPVALVLAVSAALVTLAARADEPPRLPSRLGLDAGATLPARVVISLASTFRSKEHRLRSLDDRATLAASLELEAGAARPDGLPLDLSFINLEVRRQFKAKVAVFFVESEREGKGATTWRRGEPDAPASFRGLLTPAGCLVAETTPVTSAAARWPGEAWLDPRDQASDADAKIRRLARYTALGTWLGAPPLPADGAARFEATFPLALGQSGLTNSFVELAVTYALETEATPEGALRIHGPAVRVALVQGAGPGERRVDRWLDVAFGRGGPRLSGELEATFDRKRGLFTVVHSRLALEHDGDFDGGHGRAGFERTVDARTDGASAAR